MSETTATPLTRDEIVARYQAADTGTKARMRTLLADQVAAYVRASDWVGAERAQGDLDAVKAVTKARTKAAPDYAALVAQRRADLIGALAMIRAGGVSGLPEGVTVDLADLPQVAPDPKRVAELANVTVRKARAGDGAVAAWIESVLGDEPMKVRAMMKAWVPTEAYPKKSPSSGAIAACLNRDGAAEYGIEACQVEGDLAATRA